MSRKSWWEYLWRRPNSAKRSLELGIWDSGMSNDVLLLIFWSCIWISRRSEQISDYVLCAKPKGWFKEYRYTKPGRAVLDQKCLYWTLWALWVLWPLRSPKRRQIWICPGKPGRKVLQEILKNFPSFFYSGRNPAWLAWSSGATVPRGPTGSNIDTENVGMRPLGHMYIFNLHVPLKQTFALLYGTDADGNSWRLCLWRPVWKEIRTSERFLLVADVVNGWSLNP